MRLTYRIALTVVIILFLALYAFASFSAAEIAPEPPETPSVTQETPPPELTPEPTPELSPEDPAYIPDPEEVEMLAKLVYGEARGIKSQTEQAAVVWCVLNRVDSTGYGMGRNVKYVVTYPGQFVGYSSRHPTVDDYGRDLCELAADVLARWHRESQGETDVGRVLPKEYLWFCGKHGHNVFRNAYKGGDTWDWSLPSPYES